MNDLVGSGEISDLLSLIRILKTFVKQISFTTSIAELQSEIYTCNMNMCHPLFWKSL